MASAKGRAKGATDTTCKGTTKQGRPCGNKPKAGTEYCGRHQPERIHPLDRVLAQRDGKDVTARDVIIEGIKAGASFKDAANAAGISERSFYEYRARGQEWVSALVAGEMVPSDVSPFAQFAHDVEKANGEAVVSAIAIIRSAARGRAPRIIDGQVLDKGQKPEWMAAAWIAERKNPAAYARPARIEHTGKGGESLKPDAAVDLSRLTIAEREQLLQLQEKMQPNPEEAQ